MNEHTVIQKINTEKTNEKNILTNKKTEYLAFQFHNSNYKFANMAHSPFLQQTRHMMFKYQPNAAS